MSVAVIAVLNWMEYSNAGLLRGTIISIGVNLTLAGRLKPQLYKQNPPARVSRVLIVH